MRLNHVNLTVPDVAVTRAFFETYFGLQCVVERGRGALAVLVDESSISQSEYTAMAFRAAAASTRPVAAVIALGGDVPPEIDRASLQRIPRVLLGHGTRDHWYTEEKFAADVARLRDAGVSLETCEFDAPHEWAAPFVDQGRRLLDLVIG